VRCQGVWFLSDDEPYASFARTGRYDCRTWATDETTGREANSVRQSTGVSHRDPLGGEIQIQSDPDRHLLAGLFTLYRVEPGSRADGGETGVLHVVELPTTCRNGR